MEKRNDYQFRQRLHPKATTADRAQKNGTESELNQSIELALDPVTAREKQAYRNYFLRWRILALMRRFFLPTFRRPFPVLLVPTLYSPNID